jgi:hypothetical protein
MAEEKPNPQPQELDKAPSNRTKAQQEVKTPTTASSELFQRGVIHSWRPGSWTAMVLFGSMGEVEPAHWVAGGMMSALLGLRVNFHPEPGTEVLVLTSPNTKENFIVAALGNPTGRDYYRRDTSSEEDVIETAAGEILQGTTDSQRGDLFSNKDRVPGEGDILNAHGVGISFLQNLVRLKASELSMIECHLMDDLVRIVSDNFEHVNAFGTFQIVNDGGRPTIKWAGSSKGYEAEGRSSPDEGFDSFGSSDPFSGAAKERFQTYIGHLGNLVHMFIHEPQQSINEFAAGRFRMHINEDGSFLMQSVSDIIFEKTVRVPVPKQKKPFDDPTGEKLAELNYEPDDRLRAWVAEDDDNLFYEAYKLRDYARWMNDWFSLAQFHRSRKDYDVPSGSDQPAPTVDNGNDPERPNEGLQADLDKQLTSYATIRIFRDGSILLFDGYGSSVHMGGGDITMSSSRHVRIESAGDTIVTVGRDFVLKARRHIDMFTQDGGITMRGTRWLRLLAEKGQAILESTATATEAAADAVDGLTDAVIVRAKSHTLQLASVKQIVVSTLSDFMITARNLLMRGRGIIFKNPVDQTSFAVDSDGQVSAKTVNAEIAVKGGSMVTGTRVPVIIPYPNGDTVEQESLVVYEEDAGNDVADNLDEANDSLDSDTLSVTRIFNTDASFGHHDEFEQIEFPQSITQALISSASDRPPTISSIVYASADAFKPSLFRGVRVPGEINPGVDATQKTYTARSQALHKPSARSSAKNRGKTLTPRPWTFTCIE